MKTSLWFLSCLFVFQAHKASATLFCSKIFQERNNYLSEEKTWGQQIFLLELKNLDEILSDVQKLKKSEQVPFILKADIRKKFFLLQYLSKLYENYDPQFFGELRTIFKDVEDRLGRVALYRSLSEMAAKMEEPRLQEYFTRIQDQAVEQFFKKLNRLKQVNDETAESSGSSLEKIQRSVTNGLVWGKVKNERAVIVHDLAQEIKGLHKKIEDREFDHQDIEKGLHELRRKLRVFLITFLGLRKVIVFKDTPELPQDIKDWAFELQKKGYPPFSRETETAVHFPLVIPREMTDVIQGIVFEIGDYKDLAESYIYTHEALEIMLNSDDPQLKISKRDRDRILIKLKKFGDPESIDHRELANEFQKKLDHTNLLKLFARWIKDLNQ